VICSTATWRQQIPLKYLYSLPTYQTRRNDSAKGRNVFSDPATGSALVCPVGNARSLCNSDRPTAPYFLNIHTSRPSSRSEARYSTKRRSARALTHGSACLPLAGASGPYQVLRGGQTHTFQKLVHS